MEHPDGGQLSLPLEETTLSLAEAGVISPDTSRLFDPEKLLRLSKWVAACSKLLDEKISCVPDDSTEEHKKTNEKTSTKRSTSTRRRTDETAGQTNSTVSGQDARHNRGRRSKSQESI